MVDQTELAGVAARLARLRQEMLDEGQREIAKYLSHAISDIKKVRAARVIDRIPDARAESADVALDVPLTDGLPADRRKAARAARRDRQIAKAEDS